MCHVALSFTSLRLLIRTPHREWSALRIRDVADVESSGHPDPPWQDATGPLRTMQAQRLRVYCGNYEKVAEGFSLRYAQ